MIEKKLTNSTSNRAEQDKTILEYALDYYDKHGLCVIPIPLDKKQAQIEWKKYQTERPDREQLHEWFKDNFIVNGNIAVVVGEVSGGLTILDFDAMDLYERWKSENPGLAETLPTVKTSRGMHVYFRSTLDKNQEYKEIKLFATDGYVLLPPSVHPDGTEYEWVIKPNGELPVLNPLEWELEGLTEETEETEEIEDIEETEDIEANTKIVNTKIPGLSIGGLNKDILEKINKIISSTQPSTVGERNEYIFPFCQWMKGIPELAGLPTKKLKPIVREWHKRALPVIGTKPFVETWSDFVVGWNRVKWPKGEALKKVVQAALEAQDTLPEAEEYDSTKVQLLVRICYEFQKLQGKEPFWLSCYDAGKSVGVSHTKANDWLEMLVADEILELVKKNTTEYATRYKYIGGERND